MTRAQILAGFAALAASTGTPAFADPISQHRWTARLLVVLAPSETDRRLADQRRIVADAGDAVADRDLLVIEGVGEAGDARALRRRFGVRPAAFKALLIGKDGGTKLASDAPIPADALFSEIDSMPMRRDEMRQRGP